MELNNELFQIEFDKSAFLKRAQDTVEGTVRDAARAFYRAAFHLIPVQTGMARGSLIPLGAFLRNVPTTVRPIADPVPPPYPPVIHYPQGKSLEAGIDLGQGAFLLADSGLEVTFEFQILVHHYVINESSWQTLTHGEIAAIQRLEDNSLNQLLQAELPKTIEFRRVSVS